MAHQIQKLYIGQVRNKFPHFFHQKRVLEIGSLNINGTVRDFFTENQEYIGCDLGPGDGVDIISLGHELPYENNSFDVAISCECFEHDIHWVKTFQKMIDLVVPDGLILMTCATTGRAEHGTKENHPTDAPFTLDYYKNLTEEDFRNHFDFDAVFKEYQFSAVDVSHDLQFWGIKK